MSKFSVKKPFTIFVAVIAVIVLGVVAYLKMTPDLLPNMNFPYIMIMTTYPGANPETVEAEVTKPMEQSMSTLEHIKEVTSTSGENYSMVMLEFEESVNLDTIGVDIQQKISALQSQWDDMVSTPYVLKINPSMLPVEVAAVSMNGKDTVQLTQFLDEELMNKLEGIPGVARISTSGAVVQQMHIALDQQKLDQLNETLSTTITGKMDDAQAELNAARKDLEKAQKELNSGKNKLESGREQLTNQTAAGVAEVDYQLSQLIATRSQLETTLQMLEPISEGLKTIETQSKQISSQLSSLKQLKQQLAALEQQQAAMDARIAAIESSGKSADEIEAELAELKNSAEYIQLQATKAALDAMMTANGITPETLDQTIATLEAAIDALDAKAAQLEQILMNQGIEPENLDTQLAELKAGLQQVNAGIDTLKETKQSLNKAQMDGMMELNKAATELAVGQTTVTDALAQLEAGEKTLADTRESTLSQTDLNKILTMDMVKNILTAQNFSMPAGSIQGEEISYMVSVGDKITTAQELENLLLLDLNMEGVEPIYLKDVAGIMITDNRNETYARLDGMDSLILSFEKQSTYATAETTENIEARFRQLEQEYEGLKFVSLMNQGDYIFLIVDTILNSLLLGAIFAVIILFLFLWDLRPTFITLCSIPISVVFAIVLMYFSGVTINMISLSGLAVAVGMLVDNSVVVIENIYRLRSKGVSAVQAAVAGAKQVAGAVTSSTLTTVCVFLPIVFIQGITRQLFTDLALTMTYALMASLIVSLTLVPALAAGLLKKERKKAATMPGWLMRGYNASLSWSLKHKWVVLLLAVGLLAGSAFWSLSKGFAFMPEMDTATVTVTVTMPEDSTVEEAAALSDEVLHRLENLEGIKTTGAMMGGDILSSLGGSLGGATSTNVTIYVILEDENASGAAIGEQIEALCAGMDCEVTATSAMMDMSLLTGSGVSMNIYCEDMETLQAAAKIAADKLVTVPGVAEVSDGLEDVAPALHINIDRNKAMQKGITVAQIYMELAAALQSETTVTTLNLDGTATSVIVKKPEGAVMTVDKLKDYPFSVTTQLGDTNEFVLSDVATVEETTSLQSINRVSQRRYITVTAIPEEGQNVTLLTAKAQKAVKDLTFGEDVTYAFTGENETIMEAIRQLGLMLLLGILLVYLVMVAQFQSLKSPFIVMFTIPLAFTGGFIGLLICNMDVSVISLIGFVMLTGIIVNNGIVLVDYINQLRQDGVSRIEAIKEAGATRMRPILMTTITTILGLIDMAIHKTAGTTLMQPVAVVCISGLTYATLMTLYVVPCIYDILNKKELRKVDDADLQDVDL